MVNVFLFVLLVLKFDRVVFISRRKPDRRVRRRPPNCRLPGQLLKPGRRLPVDFLKIHQEQGDDPLARSGSFPS